MIGDGASLLQFADRAGLNLFALLTIGFALHAASGVVERDGVSRFRWPTALAIAATILFALGRFVLLVGQMGDGSSLLDPELLPLAWMALGPSTTLLLGGALIAGAGVLWRLRLLAALGALGLASSFGFTGHTQGVAEPGLLPAIAAIHVLIAGFWIGAPATLSPTASLNDGALIERLRRFSAIAVVAIPVLVILGLWLALALAGRPETLFVTVYGRLLLLKLAIGLAAMGVGALNKQVITARILTNPLQGRRWLRMTLVIEATLFTIAIVAVSAATTIAGPSE